MKLAKGHSLIGERYELEIGPVAHGGHFVARVVNALGESRVVFVRHALPGERAVVEITEGGTADRFLRGDAVEILRPSPHRRLPECPYAGPGKCGGCDFQHVALAAQRELKADVLREQLWRLAGISLDAVAGWQGVEAVPGDDHGQRWRTRQQYVDLPHGRGMRKHRSHDVIAVDDCLIARRDAREPSPGVVRERVEAAGETREFDVAADGFWQVHPGAPAVLVETVLGYLDPEVGESVLDLYAGVGLFARFLAERVGSGGRVVAIEGDKTASELSRTNVPGVEAVTGDVGTALPLVSGDFDLVVLDPPREGARRAVVEQVVTRRPRAVAYVACDPAALARDLGIFAEHGYALAALRAFDLFPMTHHFECVALLAKAGPGPR